VSIQEALWKEERRGSMNALARKHTVVFYVLVFALLGMLFCPVEGSPEATSLLLQKVTKGGALGAGLGLLAGGMVAWVEARRLSKRKPR
jgi:hypothetical protein